MLDDVYQRPYEEFKPVESSFKPQIVHIWDGLLTEFCFSFNSGDVLPALNRFPKDSELRLFIGSYEAAKDRSP